MQLFYTTDIIDNLARLSAEEARHCVQVLRKQAGDLLDLVDGNGFFYKGEIIETSKKECLVKILERRAIENQRPYLQMAIAPTKNIDRFEWFLEKATEIGVDEVIP
ncbi:MAG: 16S rRNA (uracil1498-N3)-methyltransferase, partial [Saprospiraceae bacterium]